MMQVFYASPMVADHKLYALDTEGVMHIMEVSKEPVVLGTPALGEEGFSTPAFDQGKIIIRSKQQFGLFWKVTNRGARTLDYGF